MKTFTGKKNLIADGIIQLLLNYLQEKLLLNVSHKSAYTVRNKAALFLLSGDVPKFSWYFKSSEFLFHDLSQNYGCKTFSEARNSLHNIQEFSPHLGGNTRRLHGNE